MNDDVSQSEPNVPTGYAHPHCYAHSLNDCSGEISREHYISHGILKRINASGGIVVSGVPWMQVSESRCISPSNLVANVLCKKHNRILSVLDATALDFFDELDAIGIALKGVATEGISAVKNCDGTKLELWMLKVLLGMFNAGGAKTIHGAPVKWQTMPFWVKVLFGCDSLPQGCGFYMVRDEGKQIRMEQGIWASPRTNDGFTITGDVGEIYGLNLSIHGIPFFCNLADPPNGHATIPSQKLVYRPQEIIIKKYPLARTMRLEWPDSHIHQQVEFDFIKKNG